MNKNDELNDIWNHSYPAPNEDLDPLKLIRQENVRSRRWRIRMGLFGFNLTATAGLACWCLFAGKTHLGEAWPALIMLIGLWGTYIEFIRFRLRQADSRAGYHEDLRAAVSKALANTRASVRESRILIAVNLLLVVPLTIASVQKLLASGRMTDGNAVNLGVVCTIVFGGNLLFLGLRYLRELKPRLRILSDRIEEFD